MTPLAPHFAKAAQSASALLNNYDYEAFSYKLLGSRVGLAFDQSAATTHEGQTALRLCADLLARLYPNLDIVALAEGDACSRQADALRELCKQVNPNIDIATAWHDSTRVVIIVGATDVKLTPSCQKIFVGSDEWTAKVDTDAPLACGHSENPFGASVAACIGAANVFRLLFGEQLGDPALDRRLRLDVLNGRLVKDDGAPLSTFPDHVPVGEVFLVGVGAIGHGFAWALTQTRSLIGTLHLVDPENYDDTNAQRYVGMGCTDRGSKASSMATRVRASHPPLQVVAHEQTWDQFLHERLDWQLDRVALALDSAEDRRFAQASLPRWIANAWTQRDNIGVSRHDFLNTACVCCLYMPATEVAHFDELVAQALRFEGPDAIKLVREYLDTGRPLDSAMVQRIASQVRVSVDKLQVFEGKSLEALYQRAACGGMILEFGGALGTMDRLVEVPMAFQSALAGILLAVEVIAEAAGWRSDQLPVRTEINLLRPIKGTLSSPEAKHSSGRCICEDADFVEAYEAKYGNRSRDVPVA